MEEALVSDAYIAQWYTERCPIVCSEAETTKTLQISSSCFQNFKCGQSMSIWHCPPWKKLQVVPIYWWRTRRTLGMIAFYVCKALLSAITCLQEILGGMESQSVFSWRIGSNWVTWTTNGPRQRRRLRKKRQRGWRNQLDKRFHKTKHSAENLKK